MYRLLYIIMPLPCAKFNSNVTMYTSNTIHPNATMSQCIYIHQAQLIIQLNATVLAVTLRLRPTGLPDSTHQTRLESWTYTHTGPRQLYSLCYYTQSHLFVLTWKWAPGLDSWAELLRVRIPKLSSDSRITCSSVDLLSVISVTWSIGRHRIANT